MIATMHEDAACGTVARRTPWSTVGPGRVAALTHDHWAMHGCRVSMARRFRRSDSAAAFGDRQSQTHQDDVRTGTVTHNDDDPGGSLCGRTAGTAPTAAQKLWEDRRPPRSNRVHRIPLHSVGMTIQRILPSVDHRITVAGTPCIACLVKVPRRQTGARQPLDRRR